MITSASRKIENMICAHDKCSIWYNFRPVWGYNIPAFITSIVIWHGELWMGENDPANDNDFNGCSEILTSLEHNMISGCNVICMFCNMFCWTLWTSSCCGHHCIRMVMLMAWNHHADVGWSVDVRSEMLWETLNSLWPSDILWRHRSESTLALVMACCMTASILYLKQCWLSSERTTGILWKSMLQ